MATHLEALLGRSLLHTTPHAIVAVDPDQTIRFFNAAAETIFGYPAEAAYCQPLALLLPEEARDRHRRYVAEFAQGPERTQTMGQRGEIRGCRANGTTFPAEASIIKLSWEGKPLLVAILNDLTERKALEEERRRLAEVVEATPDFVGIADTQGRVVYHNPAARRLLGQTEPHVGGGWEIRDSHPRRYAERIQQEALPAARERGYWEGETAFLSAEGEEIPVVQQIVAPRDEGGEVRYYATIARDLRPHKEAQHELRMLTRALVQTADMVWITDPQGEVEFVNPAFEATTGYAAGEAVGRHIADLLHSGHHDSCFYQELWQTLARGEDFQAVFTNRTRDGTTLYLDETISPVTDEAGELTHFIATGRDVTERFRMEERLRHLAYYDGVTGLANRAHFEEHLERILPGARRDGRELAVIFMDLDRFKYINDTLGHAAGDAILALVAERLADRLREGDLLARLGGDEFACLLTPVKGTQGAATAAQKLLDALEAPFEIRGHSFGLNATLGISFFPDSAHDAAELLRQADTAMFEAKRAGGGRYQFFSQALSEATAQRFHFEKGLRQAVEQGTVVPHYQPILDLSGRHLAGAEALARCEIPGLGPVSPGEFIPVAEETGLIHPLGEQVLAQACRQAREWLDAGHALGQMAVNLSPVQLQAEDFPQRVARILERTGLPAECLELEITEEAILSGEAAILGRLGELRELGVAIALDDFGTGYSSPAYLKRIPAERLKIDRAFIRGIDHDPANQTILRSLLVLAEGFGFRVTAEGVETEAEEGYLSGTYCQAVQGFLYARPCPADEFRDGPLHTLTAPDGPDPA